jgi:hypothetical protein
LLAVSSSRLRPTNGKVSAIRLQGYRQNGRFWWFIGGIFAFQKRETAPLRRMAGSVPSQGPRPTRALSRCLTQ